MRHRDKSWWWLAVNGASGAASPMDMIGPTVSPTPEQLFGFATRAEQRAAQALLLTAPIGEVNAFVTGELAEAVADGRVAYRRPADPEPPTDRTAWLEG